MAPKSVRAAVLLKDVATTSSRSSYICHACRHTLVRRNYASAAAAQVTVDGTPIIQSTGNEPSASSVDQPRILIKAGVVVSRPPLVTPDPHPFENAFYFYQRRLNERLALPFTQYFYFKRSSPAFDQWKIRRAQRGGAAARDVGKYNPYAKDGWNDEIALGDGAAEPVKIVEQLVEEEGRGEEFAGERGNAKLAGLRRTTEADVKDDHQSLERSLTRTLYLLVKNKAQAKDQPDNSLWRFPSSTIEDKEGLKDAAQRTLNNSCGVNMNTWFVGNHPVGHYVQDLVNLKAITDAKRGSQKTTQQTDAVSTREIDTEKTFFMKARIFAGQADLKNNKNEIQDFRWLTKQEIERVVSPGYWSRIKNMLVEQ